MKDTLIINSIADFDKEILQSEKPAAVYFYSEDCAPCTVFEPIFRRMAENLSDNMKFYRVFRQQNRNLADRLGIKSSPTVLFFKNGTEACARLTGYISKPELRRMAENVLGGVCPCNKREKVYCDVLILGGGPAGLSAAIYAARAKLYTVVVDEGIPGGQVSSTFHVANYPGTNGVIRGMDLMENMKKQALDFGTQIDDMKEIERIGFEGEEKLVETEDTEYFAKTVIIATGAQPRKLPAEGEREFRGRGVHYCATCDGALYQDADVVVVGGGNSAVDEALFLTRYAKSITVIHRGDHFTGSKAGEDELLKHPAVSVVWNTEVRKILGETFVTGIEVEDVHTHETREIKTDGVFVYIGMQPKTELFNNRVGLDEYKYIVTDEDMNTNVRGVFAAGDVRRKSVRQIATAAADGVVAGIMAERFLKK